MKLLYDYVQDVRDSLLSIQDDIRKHGEESKYASVLHRDIEREIQAIDKVLGRIEILDKLQRAEGRLNVKPHSTIGSQSPDKNSCMHEGSDALLFVFIGLMALSIILALTMIY